MEGHAEDAGFGVGLANVRTGSGLLVKLVGYNEPSGHPSTGGELKFPSCGGVAFCVAK